MRAGWHALEAGSHEVAEDHDVRGGQPRGHLLPAEVVQLRVRRDLAALPRALAHHVQRCAAGHVSDAIR